jgi:hypothetical protein
MTPKAQLTHVKKHQDMAPVELKNCAMRRHACQGVNHTKTFVEIEAAKNHLYLIGYRFDNGKTPE